MKLSAALHLDAPPSIEKFSVPNLEATLSQGELHNHVMLTGTKHGGKLISSDAGAVTLAAPVR